MSKAKLSSNYQETERPREACGITAIFSKKGKPVSHLLPSMQDELQHRGRDSAGIATFSMKTGEINVYKELGRVREVFPPDFDFDKYGLLSNVAIGHNRYGTSGDGEKDNIAGAQPMIARWNGRTVAIAYNGNLPDSERQKLRERIPPDMPEGPNFDTVDIAQAIVSAPGDTWEERIENGLEGVYLAYALTILTDRGEVFGLRCPAGTWPLWVGETKDQIIFASETRVDKRREVRWRPVIPGELVKATVRGVVSSQIFTETRQFRCALHDVYGAWPDSKMTQDKTYGELRKYLGKILAQEHPIEADIYAGIPNTGLPIAKGYTERLGKKITPLLTLRDRTRGFIGRDDFEINAVINGKYAIFNSDEIKDKKVVLLDDSLIRGKTTGGDKQRGIKGVVALVREAGASEVHLGLILPKFVNDCDMGYYIRKYQLAALACSVDGVCQELEEKEIAQRVGADSVHFLSTKGLEDAYQWIYGEREVACMRCMGQLHPLEIMARADTVGEPKGEPILTSALTP